MKRFIYSIEGALKEKNWYAALSLTLILPDLCGALEQPNAGSEARYTKWFDRYVGPKYSAVLGIDTEPTVFLSGKDCYALRCAYIHEGSDKTARQRAHDALTRFRFMAPSIDSHMNKFNRILQLALVTFCNDMNEGARQWLRDVANRPDVQKRIHEDLVYIGDTVEISQAEFDENS